jgi:hypothetical protein
MPLKTNATSLGIACAIYKIIALVLATQRYRNLRPPWAFLSNREMQ